MKFLTRILPLAALAPSFAFAATTNLSYFTDIISKVESIIGTLIPIVLALGLLMFLWGMFQYFILGAGDEGKRETGRSFMIYGLIGLAVMVAVWGLVNLLITIVGVDTTTNTVRPPAIPK